MNPEVRRSYAAAAGRIEDAFKRAGGFPDQEVTPPLLIEAIDQCIEIAGDAAGTRDLSAEELDELGTHALDCVSDLALWAAHLGLESERAAVEDLALEFGRWLAARGGRLSVIEPVVNALARRANATQERERLVPLTALARALVGAVADAARADAAGARADAAGAHAWQTLNVNYAIIATRTQRPELMREAYDRLEANLPEHCPAFFQEGVRESAKPVYGAHVGALLRERLAKWTATH